MREVEDAVSLRVQSTSKGRLWGDSGTARHDFEISDGSMRRNTDARRILCRPNPFIQGGRCPAWQVRPYVNFPGAEPMIHLYYKLKWYINTLVLLTVIVAIAIVLRRFDSVVFKKFGLGHNETARHARTVSVPPSSQNVPAPSLAKQNPREQISQANSLLSEASVYAGEAVKAILTWESEVEPLRDRQVEQEATEADDLFDKLAYVVREDRMTAEELREASVQIASWQHKLNDLSRESDPSALSVEQMAEISELHRRCQTANDSWRLAVQRAFAITRQLVPPPSRTAELESPPTLESKLSEADAKATLELLDEEMEHTRIQRAEQRLREAELEEQRELKALEAAQLFEEAQSPEVQATLSPFLTPRSIQPCMSGASIRLKPILEPRPMSYAALQNLGALVPTEAGYERLAAVGGHRKLSEPKWAVHSQAANWSDDDRDLLATAQQMLRDYGPTLVKEGLLTK